MPHFQCVGRVRGLGNWIVGLVSVTLGMRQNVGVMLIGVMRDE